MTKRGRSHHRIRLIMAARVCARLIGLLRRTRPPGRRSGLWIQPCWAIHTVGMRFAIDVAFVDRNGNLRRLVRNLPPWRFAFCFGAASVIELAVNHSDSTLRYRRRLLVALRRYPQ